MSEIKPWREHIEKHDAYIIMCNVLDDLYEKEAIKKEVFERLRQAPSTDRMGQWKEVGTFTDDKGITTHVLNCLECGALHKVSKLWTGEYVNAEYCPHCGADMRGARDGR